MTNSIVKPCDYNLDNLTFSPLLSNKKKSAQIILLPSYNGTRSPMIQLPPIDLDMYGIPSKCEFYKEDWQRMFLKIPLNQKNPEIKKLTVDFLMKLDVKISSMNFKEMGIGGKGKIVWKYQPIVRCTLGEDGTPSPDKHSYMKVKLTTAYPTNEILTSVVEEAGEKKERTLKTDTTTIDEFTKYFRLQTNIRCMIVPVKLWIHQVSATEYSYGLAFKLIKALVRLPLTRAVKNQDDCLADFLDSDSD